MAAAPSPVVHNTSHVLGRGGEAVVTACTVDGQDAVLKKYRGFRSGTNEAAALRLLHHHGVTHNVVEVPLKVSASQMAYPRYAEDLFCLLTRDAQNGERNSVATANAAARRMARLVLAVARMHAVGVVHLDLKHENILMDSQGEPVVADFGFARCARACTALSPAPPSTLGCSGGVAGGEDPLCPGATPLPDDAFWVRREHVSVGNFAPPQCWMGQAAPRVDGRRCDTYSLGVIAAYCLTSTGVGICMTRRCTVLPAFPAGTPASAMDFVRLCTTFKEGERPTVRELLEHPWLAGEVEVLQGDIAAGRVQCRGGEWWRGLEDDVALEEADAEEEEEEGAGDAPLQPASAPSTGATAASCTPGGEPCASPPLHQLSGSVAPPTPPLAGLHMPSPGRKAPGTSSPTAGAKVLGEFTHSPVGSPFCNPGESALHTSMDGALPPTTPGVPSPYSAMGTPGAPWGHTVTPILCSTE